MFKTKKMKWIGVAVLVVLLAVGGFFYYRYYNSAAAQNKRAQAQTANLIKQVGRIVILPTGDDPTVFDIQDPALLISQQAFFTGSIKGDKLLVYPKTGKAVIYSPSRRMIVNMGPITFDQGKTNGTEAPTGTTKVNSSTTTGQ